MFSRETRHSREADESQSEVAERSPETFDALRDIVSCSRKMERGDGWSPLHEEAVRNGEKKLKQYQQEFSKWQEKDRDSTLDAFQRDFVTTITEEEKGVFLAESKAKEGEGYYNNEININNGEITGLHNFKRATEGWHFSEVVFNQLQLVMQEQVKKDIASQEQTQKDITKKAEEYMASFDLKNWRDEKISNKSTRSIVGLFLPAGTNKHTFEKGSEGFLALAGTPTAQSKFYLLAQHQKALGQKEVTSITVERQIYLLPSTINIIYNYGQG
jgi:hypothetical protein